MSKNLGKCGLKVSDFAFGTMSFGGDADVSTSRELFALCVDSGIDTFDCANVYSSGRAEEILGDCIAGNRDRYVITTKAYFRTGEGANDAGASRRHLRLEVEKSLRRLKTDYIDIFFVHKYDPVTPLEETFAMLEDLIREGKILYSGVSNFSAWQSQRATDLAAHRGWSPVAVVQPMYNLLKRQCEVEILPQALDAGIGVMPYSPLAAGLLTGKYHAPGDGSATTVGRLNQNRMYAKRYGGDAGWACAQKFAGFARTNGFDPAALAIAWVASHPAVTAPILGARNCQQLISQLAARDIVMTEELRREIAGLSPEPGISTDRAEELVS